MRAVKTNFVNSEIFVIIPAFNEGAGISGLLRSLIKFGLPVIVIDDGSKDKTYKIARKFKVSVLRHKVNLGKGSALKTGCEAALRRGAKALIFMDADGQHSVSDLPFFIEKIKAGKYDVVFCSRNLNFGVPLDRFLGNKIASVVVNVFIGRYISDILCGYRAMTTQAYRKINWESVGYGVETEIVVKTASLGLRYCEIPVKTLYYDRFKGVTFLDSLNILGDILRWKFQR